MTEGTPAQLDTTFMTSVLITGAAGFIGSNLARTLLAEGKRVYGVDNFITGRRENALTLEHPFFTFIETDIAHPHFLDNFRSIPVSEIYNLACPTGVPNLKILGHEMLATCSQGTFNVLEIARLHRARLLHTSTAEVYGQPEKFPQDEAYHGNVDPMGERSPYEEGKRFAESVIATYVRLYGVDARVVRVFNTYGPGMSLDDRRVIPQFIRSIVSGEPLRIYGDGSQTRCHLYVDDLIAGLRIVMDNGIAGEAYNVGSETPLTVRELAEHLIRLSGRQLTIVYEPHFIEDHRHRRPAVSKAIQLGWRQEVTLEEGLRRMLATYTSTFPTPLVSLTTIAK